MIYAIAAIIALGCLIIATMEHFERKACKDGARGSGRRPAGDCGHHQSRGGATGEEKE